MFKKYLWRSDILSIDAGRLSAFLKYFAIKNQLPALSVSETLVKNGLTKQWNLYWSIDPLKLMVFLVCVTFQWTPDTKELELIIKVELGLTFPRPTEGLRASNPNILLKNKKTSASVKNQLFLWEKFELLVYNVEGYSEPCKTPKMKFFAKITTSF